LDVKVLDGEFAGDEAGEKQVACFPYADDALLREKLLARRVPSG